MYEGPRLPLSTCRHVTRYLLGPEASEQKTGDMLKNSGKSRVLNVTGDHIENLIKTSGFLTPGRGSACEMLVGLNPPQSGTGNMRFPGATSFG